MSQNKNWTPPSPEDDFAETDFENNPALADEVAADALQWAGTVEPESYEVGDKAAEVGPETVQGMMEANPEI